jgi:hypothetical protein
MMMIGKKCMHFSIWAKTRPIPLSKAYTTYRTLKNIGLTDLGSDDEEAVAVTTAGGRVDIVIVIVIVIVP